MTALVTPSSPVGAGRADPAPTGTTPPGRPAGVFGYLGPALTMVSLLLLTFVAEMVLVGPVRYERAQAVAYKELRAELANAVAPTGQLDFEGKPVPLGAPVALLTIPSIGVRSVVLQGTTSGVLMSGPGHRRDTVMPGQPGVSVVMGRQATYGSPFGGLERLRPGDEIAVADGQGTLLFEVVRLRRAGDGVPPVEAGSAWLTLVTGDGPRLAPTDVLRVDARLEGKAVPAPSMPYPSLTSAEEPMKGDSSVLLTLLLWAQLLLLLAVALVWVRSVWGRWQTWMIGVPLLGAVSLQVSHQVAQLLPNLL